MDKSNITNAIFDSFGYQIIRLTFFNQPLKFPYITCIFYCYILAITLYKFSYLSNFYSRHFIFPPFISIYLFYKYKLLILKVQHLISQILV